MKKWFTPTSADGQRTLKQHAFRSAKRLDWRTQESYIGNRALCSARIQLTKEGPEPLTIEEIDGEPLDEENACKKCKKMRGIK